VTHDPEAVAAYVSGELTGAPHDEFENHLLSCEDCWAEVERSRQGRQLALLAREAAPDALRAGLTAELTLPPRRWRPSRLVVALAAACVGVVCTVAGTAVVLRSTAPEPILVAVAQFRAARLPGEAIPTTPAPDLTKLGLSETAAGSGDLAGVPVTAYAYRDSIGRRLLLYVGRQPFTTPRDAERYEGGDAWITRHRGVSVLCGRDPHATLVVGQDEEQVTEAAEYLDLT
jgi:anti-sigma factor RsiW